MNECKDNILSAENEINRELFWISADLPYLCTQIINVYRIKWH